MSLFKKRNPNRNVRCKKIKEKSLPSRRIFYVRKSFCANLKEAPRYACKASYTLEAAVIIPLLACFFVGLLFFFRVMQVQLEVQQVLDDTSRKLAVYAVAIDGEKEKSALSSGIGLGTAKAMLITGLLKQEYISDWVEGGSAGVSILTSDVSGDDINLVATYQIKLPVNLPVPYKFKVIQRSCCRKWTGWKSGEDEENSWVYITETGTVYHTTRSCTHLELSIRSVAYEDVGTYRSSGGGKYGACPICAKAGETYGRVYITNYGSCYHADLNCSGIKRTIYQVRRSDVGDKRACSKCGSGT